MDISALRERRGDGVMSVSELNSYIKNVFESDRTLKALSVSGEISNFTRHSTGHLYFSLKDGDSQIKAIMFRSSAERLLFVPENGMKVTVRGSVSVYPRDGTYSIYVYSIQPNGIGALYLAYEQLKEKLAAEGLFDEDHKIPIPRIPRSVGVITSPTGAAVRDIINVTGRRFPLARIYVYPVLVQGDGAEQSLIKALDYFDTSGLCDVVIIGRGGGSIEDLWAFNGERLARRIYSASVPIISAVGHETDFTICDFVSDMRAPTPSAAAELAVPDMHEIYQRVDEHLERCLRALISQAVRKREKLERIAACTVLRDPLSIFDPLLQKTELLYERLLRSVASSFNDRRGRFSVLTEKLDSLSPLAVLSRGFASVERKGNRIMSAASIAPGDELSLTFADGKAVAVVKETERKT